jgi:hypothetical protein
VEPLIKRLDAQLKAKDFEGAEKTADEILEKLGADSAAPIEYLSLVK